MNTNDKKIVALYCRLSNDDGGESDSNSILNQKKVLKEFAENSKFQNLKFYIDDGCSGTNFNRPAMNELLSDIDNNYVSTVIVKDMSRFGRNYLLVGYYTEIYFPSKSVRFIAVNDNVDTEKNMIDEFTPFKNIMNEWYARDTSKKIKASFRIKGESGIPLTSNLPYGYKKDIGNNWVIDEPAAKIVKLIFKLFAEGKGTQQIATILRKNNILTPSAYKISNGEKPLRKMIVENDVYWQSTTIANILDNKNYLGHILNFKTYRNNFKDKKKLKNDEKNILIFENHHEAIIDNELFNVVQALRKQKRTLNKQSYSDEVDIFIGFLVCADCGSKLNQRRFKDKSKNYYICSSYKNRKQCTVHNTKTDYLVEYVKINIKRIFNLDKSQLKKLLIASSNKLKDIDTNNIKNKTKDIKKRLDELDTIIKNLYADKVKNLLPEEQFLFLYDLYFTEQKDLKNELSELTNNLNCLEQKEQDVNIFVNKVNMLKKNYNNRLSVDLIANLFDKIVVYEATEKGKNRHQKFDLYWKGIGIIDFSCMK